MELKTPLVFFGSGPVAAASLENLIKNFAVELVITKNRPIHHKDPAPVEELAKKHNIAVEFADSTIEVEAVINNIKPSNICGVVIDYGVIISQSVIDYFVKGIVNSHFSILPQWRGADPITFSILSGQAQTGVSLMCIDAGLDTGEIIAETCIDITNTDTNSTLTHKLIDASDALINAVLPDYINGSIVTTPQRPDRITTYSRKLTKQDGLLDVNKPASLLEREIRAFNEWPKSRYVINETLTIIITKANAEHQALSAGELKITDDKQLLLGTRIGSLNITELMPLGKQKMSNSAFLNGYGARISSK